MQHLLNITKSLEKIERLLHGSLADDASTMENERYTIRCQLLTRWNINVQEWSSLSKRIVQRWEEQDKHRGFAGDKSIVQRRWAGTVESIPGHVWECYSCTNINWLYVLSCSEDESHLIERVASEFNQLQFYVTQSQGHPLVENIRSVSVIC